MGKRGESSAVAVKKALRERMKAKRAALTPQKVRQLSQAAQEALMADTAWTEARQVALYMPTRGEVSTSLLLEAAWEQGKQVLLPRCRVKQHGIMDFVPCGSLDDVTAGHFGLREPRPEIPALAWTEGEEQPALRPELLVLPGLAFDRQGYRLGFGGGYYDRALSYPALAHTVRVGLAYAWQIVAAVPVQLWDCPVNALCSEEGMLWL